MGHISPYKTIWVAIYLGQIWPKYCNSSSGNSSGLTFHQVISGSMWPHQTSVYTSIWPHLSVYLDLLFINLYQAVFGHIKLYLCIRVSFVSSYIWLYMAISNFIYVSRLLLFPTSSRCIWLYLS